jgi:hypothetical protein
VTNIVNGNIAECFISFNLHVFFLRNSNHISTLPSGAHLCPIDRRFGLSALFLIPFVGVFVRACCCVLRIHPYINGLAIVFVLLNIKLRILAKSVLVYY